MGRPRGMPLRSVIIFMALVASVMGGPWVLTKLLEGRKAADAHAGPCYAPNGPGAKAIKFKASINCKQKLGFMANVMNPLLLTHACSGVLVALNVVAVPASCLEEKRVDFPPVRLGSFNLNVADGPEQAEVLKTCRRVVHKDYQKGNPKSGADIALLFLERPAEHHTPVKGFTSIEDCNSTGGNITAFGWFMPGKQLSPSVDLQAVPNLEWLPKEQCSEKMKHEIPKGAVCTMSNIRAAIAEWDPGSPILCNDKKLLGMASYEQMTTSKYMPYVYTHIADYWGWIESHGVGASQDDKNRDGDCDGVEVQKVLWPEESDKSEL